MKRCLFYPFIAFIFGSNIMLVSCNKDNHESRPNSEASENHDDSQIISGEIIVTIDADGNADGGHRFQKIDDTNFYIDDIRYTALKGNLVVSSYNEAFFKGEGKIISKLKYEWREMDVVSIEANAFRDCNTLSAIYIPACVNHVGPNAFMNCTGLTKAEFASIESLCNISFDDYYSNPLVYAHHLFIKGNEITDLSIPSSIDEIQTYSFCGASFLKSITFPENINKIGNFAFCDCNSVTSLTIPNKVNSIGTCAFKNCKEITSLLLPEGITSIGEFSFSACKNLSSLTIPTSLADIGKSAFYGCNILSVNIKDLNSWIKLLNRADSYPFLFSSYRLYLNGKEVKTLQLPQGCNNIQQGAFAGCISFESVTFPTSLTAIQEDAFNGCESLSAVTIPPSVTFINDNAFYNCKNLLSVTINSKAIASKNYNYQNNKSPLANIFGSQVQEYIFGEAVEEIGLGACYNLSELKRVSIGNNVIRINGQAFYGCSSLSSIRVSEGNAKYSSSNGCNAIIESSTRKLICGCKNSVLPEDLDIIGRYSFVNSGETIIIPNNVTKIEINAFYGCINLKTVIIPKNVEEMGYYVFTECKSLTDVFCHSETPPNRHLNNEELVVKGIDSDSGKIIYYNEDLNYISKATLHVPSSAIDDYMKEAPWNQYGNIVPINE